MVLEQEKCQKFDGYFWQKNYGSILILWDFHGITGWLRRDLKGHRVSNPQQKNNNKTNQRKSPGGLCNSYSPGGFHTCTGKFNNES